MLAAPQLLIGAIALAWVLVALGADILSVVVITAGFVVACIPLSNKSISVAYRRMSNQFGRLQAMTGLSTAFRLVATLTVTAVSRASLVAFISINVLSNAIEAIAARWRLGSEISLRGGRDHVVERELKLVYFRALPLSVGLVVQTQLVSVLTGLLGGADILAEIAALSRFAAVLAVFAALVNDVGTGIVARSSRSRASIKRNYAIVLGAFVGLCVLLTGVMALFAPQLIWLLGPDYAGLEAPLIIVAAGTSGIMIADAMRSLNNTLAWARWSWLYIPLVAVWLTIGVLALDLKDVNQAAIWMAMQAGIGLTTQSFVFVSGFRRLDRSP
jgi:hypothetical protein